MKNRASFGIVNLLAMAFGFGNNYNLSSETTHSENKSKIFGNRGAKRGRFGKCKNQPKDYYQTHETSPS